MAKQLKMAETVWAPAVQQITELWERNSSKVIHTIEDHAAKRGTVIFKVEFDLEAAIPKVGTTIQFKETCEEDGLDVRKSFKQSIHDEAENPDQPALLDVPKKRRGKKENIFTAEDASVTSEEAA